MKKLYLKIICSVLTLVLLLSSLGVTNIVLADETDLVHNGIPFKITSFTSSDSDVGWNIPSTNKGAVTTRTDNTSKYNYVGLNSATVVGDSISYTLKDVPAGSYYVLVNVPLSRNLGYFDVFYNVGEQDVALGELRDRTTSQSITATKFSYNLNYSYRHMTYTNLVVKETGDAVIKFVCKEPSQNAGYALEVGSFLLKPDDNVSRWTDELPTLDYDESNAIDALKQKYGLSWSDEFNEGKLNYNNWRLLGTTRNVDESYTTDTVADGNVAFEKNCDGNDDGNGYLVLKQKPEPQGIKSSYSDNPNINHVYNESSGDIYSKGIKTFKYGILEMRAKLPSQYVWASFWLLGADQEKVYDKEYNWPYAGEVDIFEYLPSEEKPTGYGSALHYHGDNGGYDTSNGAAAASAGRYTNSTDLSEDFHTYGVIWTAHYMYFYCDNNIYGIKDISSVDLSEFRDRENYILLTSCARGEAVNGTPITEETQWIIDYVRLFQNEDNDNLDRDLNFKTYDVGKLNTSNVKAGYVGYVPTSSSVGTKSTFDIPDLSPGKYRIYAYNKSTGSTGKYSVSMGDTLINNNVNLNSTKTYEYFKLGVVDITQSRGAQFNLTCTSSGSFVIYNLMFVKVDEENLTVEEKTKIATYSDNYTASYKEIVPSEIQVSKSRYYSTVDYSLSSLNGEINRTYAYGFEQYATFGTCEFNSLYNAQGIKAGDYYEMDISTLDQGIYNFYMGYVGGKTPFKLQIVDESGKVTDIGTASNTSGNTVDCFENITWKTTQKAKLRFTATGTGESISVVYASVYKSENAPTDNDKLISDYYFAAGGDNSIGYSIYAQYEDSVLTAFNAKSHGLQYMTTKLNMYRLATSKQLIYNDEYLTAKDKETPLSYLPTGKYRVKILASNDCSSRQTSSYGEFKFVGFELKKGTYTKVPDGGTEIGTMNFATEQNYTSYSSDSARLYDIGTFEISDGDANMLGIQVIPTTDNTKLYFFGTVIEPVIDQVIIKGDVNDDKILDAKDCLHFQKYLAGWDVSINELNADINEDKKYNVVDLLYIKKQLAGITQW